MRWEWSGPDLVLAIVTTAVAIVTTFISLLVSTVVAVLVALWIQRREFNRETATRRQERDEQRLADRVAWRLRLADEAIAYCITIQEAALDPGNGYKSVMVDRWLDSFQARLGLGDDQGADHVAIALRRDWKAAYAAAARINNDLEAREAATRSIVLRLQSDLRDWGRGEFKTSEWAARGIGG